MGPPAGPLRPGLRPASLGPAATSCSLSAPPEGQNPGQVPPQSRWASAPPDGDLVPQAPGLGSGGAPTRPAAEERDGGGDAVIENEKSAVFDPNPEGTLGQREAPAPSWRPTHFTRRGPLLCLNSGGASTWSKDSLGTERSPCVWEAAHPHFVRGRVCVSVICLPDAQDGPPTPRDTYSEASSGHTQLLGPPGPYRECEYECSQGSEPGQGSRHRLIQLQAHRLSSPTQKWEESPQ